MALCDRNNKRKRMLLATFFIVLLSCYYFSTTVFLHSRNVNNCIIWHSHPFSNAPHSEQSMVSLSVLSVINIVLTDTVNIAVPDNRIISLVHTEPVLLRTVEVLFSGNFRAPPALTFTPNY